MVFPIISNHLWVCRVCTRLKEAMDKGFDVCGEPYCGSPLVGNSFPCYNGPLIGSLPRFCFICGADSDGVVNVNGCRIGICEEHAKELLSKDKS